MLLVLIISASCYKHSGVKWPEVTNECKPWTRWWWMGSAVNPGGLSYNMKLYKEAGFGGLEITPIYGVKGYEGQFIDFLSPQWIGMLEFTLKEIESSITQTKVKNSELIF